MGWELELTDAVYNNDDELIRQYLSTKEVKKSIGRTEWNWDQAPLHRAAAIGRNDIVKLLVEGGANLRSYSIHDNDDRLTCLHLAVWCNKADTVRLLLKIGADPNQSGTWLDFVGTPWDFAMQNPNPAVVEAFREHDKDGQFAAAGNFAGPNSLTQKTRLGANAPTVVTRVSTSAILTGLENLPLKEKALKKAQELQKKFVKAEKHLQECKRQLAMAEKDVFDIQTNPYFLSLDSIDELTMEIEELKVFSVEVRKVLSGETVAPAPSVPYHRTSPGPLDSGPASYSGGDHYRSGSRVQGRRSERARSSSGHRGGHDTWADSNGHHI